MDRMPLSVRDSDPARGRRGRWAPEDMARQAAKAGARHEARVPKSKPGWVRAWYHAAPAHAQEGALGDGTHPVYHCQSQRAFTVNTVLVRSLFSV